MTDLISVCIPVYNCEDYIRESVESALKQTYSNIEVIVIDNCSTDRTLEKLSDINDDRLKIIKNDSNIGMVNNWNKCLSVAKGKYINMLCADDRLCENCIEKKYELIKKDEKIVLVTSDSHVINPEGKILHRRRGMAKTGIYDGMKILKKSIRTKNLFGEPTNVLFRNNISNEFAWYSSDLPYSPDWEFWLHLSSFGKVGYISEPLSQFRVSNVSGTTLMIKDKNKLKKDSVVFFETVSKYANVSKMDYYYNMVYQCIRNIEKRVFLTFFVK